MDSVRAYFLSVVAASIICACIRTLVGEKGTAAGVVKLICGLFLAFTVIRPVATIEIPDFAYFTADIRADAQAAVSDGEDFLRESIRDIIKAESEAYILDKAKALSLDLRVEVTVSDDAQPIPEKVRITGRASPYAKTQLQRIIANDLGISKENQVWIG